MGSYLKQTDPIAFLPDYKGKDFTGEWPTLPEMFNISVKRYSDKACFTDFEGPNGARNAISYTEAKEKILTLANWLAVNGLTHGDRVAVTGKNSPQWAVVYLATLFAGGIVCPIDYALHDAEVENLLNTAKPKFLFVDEEKFEYFTSKKFSYKVYSLSPKHAEVYSYSLSSDKKGDITL